MTSDKKPVVYLPGVPDLENDDCDLNDEIMAARGNLARQLKDNGFRVKNTYNSNPRPKQMLGKAASSDAFLFPPMTSLPRDHHQFQPEAAQRWFEFFSIITGVHVGSREKYGSSGVSKPCVVMDPDGQWSAVTELLEDLHNKGMFSSKVDDIVHVVGKDEFAGHKSVDYKLLNKLAVEKLSEVLRENKGKVKSNSEARFLADHNFHGHRHIMTPEGKPIERHPFGVALFGSATTKVEPYLEATKKTAKLVAQRGWRMVTGAGCEGCMGAADKGFKIGSDWFKEHKPNARFTPAHIGVSTQDILRLEGPPDDLNQLIISDDIYQRMITMVRGQDDADSTKHLSDTVKVIFITPGGIGTLHEFATLMQLQTHGDMMDGRTVVFLNPPSHNQSKNSGGKPEKFWDPLIRKAEELGFANMFKVADSPEEAMMIADQVYKEWAARQEKYPDLNPSLASDPRRWGARLTRSSSCPSSGFPM